MRLFWLIMLLVALIPVRGWAAAGMAASSPLSGLHAQAEAAAVPCHAEPFDAISTAQSDDAESASHLCNSCDLCHAPLATAAAGTVTPGPAPEEGPRVGPSRDTGRMLAGGLERPPRA